MKVTLTLNQILSILSDKFNYVVTDVEIDRGVHVVDPVVLSALRCCVEQFRYTSDQKIAAIKALRTFANDNRELFTHSLQPIADGYVPQALGLADAKWAVENWGDFLNFIIKNDRVPKPGFSFGLA